MALNLSNFDAVLQDFYEGSIRETINSEVPMFKHLEETDREWSGRKVVWPVHTTRNSGVGARIENGTLPTAGNQGHQLSVVSATYQYGRIEISGPTIKAGKHAFAEAMSTEMDGLVRDLKNDLGRQTWGTGDGRIAQAGADGASASAILVYNRFATNESGQPGARYVYQGQLIAAGTVASFEAQFSAATVIAVSVSQDPATTTDTITISASSLTVSQCETFLFNAGAGGAGIEMLGVQALVDVYSQANYWGSNAFYGSAIQGINRAIVSQWDSLVFGNSGTNRVIDSNLVQIVFDRIHVESGETPDMIMGEHGVVRAFLDSVSADRRYNSPEFNAGMSALTYNGVQIERDRQAPYNSLLFMKKDQLRLFTLLDIEFANDDGAILNRVPNKDAYEAYVRCYKNIGINGSPKAMAMLRDIKTDL